MESIASMEHGGKHRTIIIWDNKKQLFKLQTFVTFFFIQTRNNAFKMWYTIDKRF